MDSITFHCTTKLSPQAECYPQLLLQKTKPTFHSIFHGIFHGMMLFFGGYRVIEIDAKCAIAEVEISWQAIRASGPGGQHVNKTETAMQLSFDIHASSLPPHYKSALLQRSDHRISPSGKIIIKCQEHRSQELNRQQALNQLIMLLASAGIVAKKRYATKPTYASQQRRLASKKHQGSTKALRRQKPGMD